MRITLKGNNGTVLMTRDARSVKVIVTEIARSGKEIRDLDLSYTNLIRANLVGFNAPTCNMSGSNLDEAFLDGAKLVGANMSNAVMRRSSLVGADLRCVDLRNSRMYRSNLQRANLQRADLTGADLRHVDLTDADLTDARVDGANFAGANLSGTKLPREGISAATFAGVVGTQQEITIDLDRMIANYHETMDYHDRLVGKAATGTGTKPAVDRTVEFESGDMRGPAVDSDGSDDVSDPEGCGEEGGVDERSSGALTNEEIDELLRED